MGRELEKEYEELQQEQAMIAQAENETFDVLNGFSDLDYDYIAWKYGTAYAEKNRNG